MRGVRGGREAAAARPNVILVNVDDLDVAATGRLAGIGSTMRDEGVSFENSFASYPLCCPSRATALTGLYAHNHGVWGNDPPNGGFEKFRAEGHEENTIAARLREASYKTALFGKYLNGYGRDDPSYVPPGWDEWHASASPSTSYYDYDLNENGEVVRYGSEREDYLTGVLSGKATGFVRDAVSDPSGEPFFVYFAPPAPHLPATPARGQRGTFAGEQAPRTPSFDEEDISDKPPWIQSIGRVDERAAHGIDNRHQRRLSSMLAVEETISALVDELENAGALDETYIIFTSDNGWQGGEHRIPLEKSFPYEESARVPLIVRGPDVPAGEGVQDLVLNTDLAPTVAELAGLTQFPADGRSLVPLLRGEEVASWRSAVLIEGFGEAFFGPPGYAAVRTEAHKYVEYATGDRELYDLRADPYEMQSLHATADASLAQGLRSRLEDLRRCAGTSCREAEDAP